MRWSSATACVDRPNDSLHTTSLAGAYAGTTTHFVWDANVPLHEWQEVASDAGKADVTT